MPKSHFSVENATSLTAVPAGGRIHIIGVCGVAMAQLAVALTELGYHVSGSDKRFYEPMGSLLRQSSVELMEGYQAENIPEEVDLIVIGNAIPYSFGEVAVTEERNLPYTFFPKLLSELLIRDRHSIVVCGTHGKSTTAALIASMLYRLSLDPSYFIGGICMDLPASLHVGAGEHSVVEGDEYDSVFFAKVPKFQFYGPDTCIVNAIEFDHADIYENVEVIMQQFDALVLGMPASGRVLCCIDFPRVRELVAKWQSAAACEIVTFGEDEDAGYHLQTRESTKAGQRMTVKGPNGEEWTWEIPLIGAYNARNALAAFIVSLELGIEPDAAQQALGQYQAVKRRQEIRFAHEQVVLIEDFAHHPTAVLGTIRAVREAYPDWKIWAIFEPRSTTSRRRVFEEEYKTAFAEADQVILREVEVNQDVDLDQKMLPVPELTEQISQAGTPALCFPNGGAILEHVMKHIGSRDLLLIMSNGSFDNLPSEMETALREKFK